jgi:hypothetical protein
MLGESDEACDQIQEALKEIIIKPMVESSDDELNKEDDDNDDTNIEDLAPTKEKPVAEANTKEPQSNKDTNEAAALNADTSEDKPATEEWGPKEGDPYQGYGPRQQDYTSISSTSSPSSVDSDDGKPDSKKKTQDNTSDNSSIDKTDSNKSATLTQTDEEIVTEPPSIVNSATSDGAGEDV